MPSEIFYHDDHVLKISPQEEGLVEKKILNMVNHPNILKIDECKVKGKKVYFKSKLKEKCTEESIREIGIEKWVKNVLDACIYLKSLGIYHGDLKVENTLYDRDTDQFLLIDFGLAACGTSELQDRDCTWYTMPPEVIKKRYLEKDVVITDSSEAYSIAMCIYLILNDDHPWGENGPKFSNKQKARAFMRCIKDQKWLNEIRDTKWFDFIKPFLEVDHKIRPGLEEMRKRLEHLLESTETKTLENLATVENVETSVETPAENLVTVENVEASVETPMENLVAVENAETLVETQSENLVTVENVETSVETPMENLVTVENVEVPMETPV